LQRKEQPRERPVTCSLVGRTVEGARRALAARFGSSGIEAADLDARELMRAALGLDLTGLIRSARRPLAALEADRLEGYARRRLAGEPVARIVGTREFWGLPLRLSAATLVPRPDTEAVVERALEAVRAPRSGSVLRILDIATGSGAILLALLSALPDAFGIGTDIAAEALLTARGNAAALGLASRAAFVVCDFAAALSGRFDLIVSNPPYIRSSDIARLPREVRDYDPHLALDGGPDGLDAYRALIPETGRLLRYGGTVVVEAGHGQSADIEALMRSAGLVPEGPPKTDLAGIPRAVAGRKMPP
jgi:release factor glutamine methyltransferase